MSANKRPPRLTRTLSLIVPGILTLVVLVQWFQVRSLGLSPWKGGGFGMFSTIDSPSARFLRIYLKTEAEEIPVLPPSSLGRQIQEVKTIPTQNRLNSLCQALAKGTWIPYRFRPAIEYYKDLQAQLLNSEGETAATQSIGDSSRVAPQQHFATETSAVFDTKLLVMVDDLPQDNSVDPTDFVAVRVEVWQIHYSRSSAQLKANKIKETTIRKHDL